jgi:hypothetical protein
MEKNRVIQHLLIFLVISGFNPFNSFGQKCTPPYTPINISYSYSSHKDKMDTTKRKATIIFEAGFQDSLEIYLNNKFITRGYFKSDQPTGYTSSKLDVDYSKRIRRSNIIISSLTGKSCIKIEIKKGFAFLEISKAGNKWSVIYSNSPPAFE